MVAFKARSGEIDPVEQNYLNPVDGIYLADTSSVATLLDTPMYGLPLDPAAPEGSKMSTLGIERESFRGSWLAITAGMVESISEASMAGIYVSKMYSRVPLADVLAGKYIVDPELAEKKASQVTMNKSGKYSGQLFIDGVKYLLKGTLNSAGEATQEISTGQNILLVKVVAAEVSGVRVLDITVTGGGVNYNKLAVYSE